MSTTDQPSKDYDKGGGSKKKKSKKKAAKRGLGGSTQPSLPQVSYDNGDNIKQTKRGLNMSILMDRLLLLIHTLLSTSKEAPFL